MTPVHIGYGKKVKEGLYQKKKIAFDEANFPCSRV